MSEELCIHCIDEQIAIKFCCDTMMCEEHYIGHYKEEHFVDFFNELKTKSTIQYNDLLEESFMIDAEPLSLEKSNELCEKIGTQGMIDILNGIKAKIVSFEPEMFRYLSKENKELFLKGVKHALKVIENDIQGYEHL